jgi:serine protease Do
MFRTIIALLFSLPYLLGAKTLLEDLETELKNIVQKVSPSIVVVESQKDDQGIKYASTGFVFDDNGDIVTLTDPTSDAKSFNVVFPNGKKYEAELFNSDDATNIAVLKLKAGKGTPVSLSSSKNIEPGSWGIIISSSYGTPSIALGIVSGQREDGMLQVSAPINPGGSGGVVVNPQAKVIGIVKGAVTSGKQVRIKTKEGEYAVMTDYDIMKEATNTILALPTDEATDIIQKLLAGEKIEHGYLGVQLNDAEKEKGALVVEVNKGTPSENAGVKKDDIIIKIDGKPVTGYQGVVKYVMDKKPGEPITIIVSRKGEEKEIKVKLTKRPKAQKNKEILKIINPELSLLNNEELLKGMPELEKNLQALSEKSFQSALTETKGAFLGVYLLDISEGLTEYFGVKTGVLIAGIVDGSSAKEAGLKSGDVIIELDGKEVEDAAALRKILAKKEPGDKLTVKFVRAKETKILELKLGKRKVKIELKRSEEDSPKIKTEERT